jgi:hypothetical protein
MDENEKELLKVGAETVVAPVKDVINRLFGPFADQLGGLMADPIRVWRYQRSLKLFEKVARLSAARGIELKAVPLKTILPILEYASVEEDEDLHNRWANLLANSAVNSDRVRPFFPDALRQLGPTEARLLDHMHDVDLEFSQKRWGSAQKMREEDLAVHSFDKILPAYEEIIGAGPPMGMEAFTRPHMGGCLETLDVLMALGLVTRIPDPNVVSPNHFSYRTTALGGQFVEACRTPGQRM